MLFFIRIPRLVKLGGHVLVIVPPQIDLSDKAHWHLPCDLLVIHTIPSTLLSPSRGVGYARRETSELMRQSGDS